MYARRRFLRAAEDVRQKFAALRMQDIHEVAAVVDDDVRLKVKRLVDVLLILFVRAAVRRKDMKPIFDERRRDVILRGQRIAARDGNLCAGVLHDQRQIRCLCFKMQRDDDLLACKGLRHGKFFVDGFHDRHEVLDPVDFVMTRRREFDVFDH